jgi:hypothetical protein
MQKEIRQTRKVQNVKPIHCGAIAGGNEREECALCFLPRLLARSITDQLSSIRHGKLFGSGFTDTEV